MSEEEKTEVMDRVEIRIDSSFTVWERFWGRLVLIWSHMRVRICFIITLVLYILIAISITNIPQYKSFLLIPAFVLFGMWLTPITRELLASIIDYKNVLTIRLDCNGIEYEEKQNKVFFNWSSFYAFRETKKRFILFAKKTNLALAKRYMSQEQINITLKILNATPLERFI